MAVTPKIIDTKKYLGYNEIEQGMFKALRLGMLAIMPIIDEEGNYEDAAVVQSETFASTVVDNWPEELKQQQIQYQFINGQLVASKGLSTQQALTTNTPTTK